MRSSTDWYRDNPYVHADRRLRSRESDWVRSFACEDMRPLIVCRGPIRKEALDVFAEMGMTHVGILLSEKDSIVYPNALAPELRGVDPSRVHRVKDYTGATKEERVERVKQILQICKDHDYDHVFAGYGFMAEDEDFVRAIEEAGVRFIGPCSYTVKSAGRKDEAKRTAIAQKVSVTPGVSNATARCLLRKHPTREALQKLSKAHELGVDKKLFASDAVPLEDLAEIVLDASYAKSVDLYSIDELAAELVAAVAEIFRERPGNRVRLKAIGGGGGKGQRILAAPGTNGGGPLEERVEKAAAKAAPALREVLSEVKATGVGDNKNVLVELNIERTRHCEIQLVGNGEWCVTLGGRDCSLQMHEQKLLEISITDDALAEAIDQAKKSKKKAEAKALEEDREVLARMEAEAARFGAAVKLDSASTFECIVEDDHHYFMEVNTRIQVEHRVSELCYALRFRNPKDPDDYFDLNSLVETMAILAKHKNRLPKPERVRRDVAAVEARLNATDRSLSPHAGGTIISWSDPIEGEIRDDQGICIKNPDTDLFVRYKLAGAYDSNIALIVTTGASREASYRRLHEALRSMTLRGQDLATNLDFHYGLVSWLLARNVYAKPTTRFVVPYLTLVGCLKDEANKIDLELAWAELARAQETKLRALGGGPEAGTALDVTRAIFDEKQTLVTRPIVRLLDEPHFLSAWLSTNQDRYEIEGGKVRWASNPIDVLADLYHLLNMDFRADAPAAHVIWGSDHELLTRAQRFYRAVEIKLGTEDYAKLAAALADAKAPSVFDAATWKAVRSAHAGFQLGLDLLDLLPRIGEKTAFLDLKVAEDLTIDIPERLLDPDLQKRMKKVLVPPPATKANEIVAETGGMYYGQEAPGMPRFLERGHHFEAGQPLYVLEVMKMFNKILAPFSGTVDDILVEGDGVIVTKGQAILKVTPDERIVDEDPHEVAAQRKAHTRAYLGLA